ncbi:MAG: Flp pilus assembly protein CpaB [Acidimicrobiia bacterium]|nr:Flp pilus assembly protein CpaB [Acidimicrobiia bacterium]
MNKRLVGLAVAVALAAGGTFVLMNYVRAAEDRVLAGEETVAVYVVSDPVAVGQSATELERYVTVEQLPTKARAAGSVTSLSQLEGQVAAVNLVPGEQLLASRFITPQELEDLDEIEIPAGLLQVSLSLSPERAAGGFVVPGDLVAVVASFSPFTVDPAYDEDKAEFAFALTAEPNTTPQATPATSHLILHKVLITSVQMERLPRETDQEGAAASGVELAPTGNLLITLATTAGDVEKVVFAAEHGSIWLAYEPADAPEDDTEIQTRLTVYR